MTGRLDTSCGEFTPRSKKAIYIEENPLIDLLQQIIDETKRAANASEKCAEMIESQNNYFQFIKDGIDN
jgi:hypothetical protein